MIGSVLQYRRNSQFVQSRVLSCLHATVKTQPVQLRTKTESTQAAMNTLLRRRQANKRDNVGSPQECAQRERSAPLKILIVWHRRSGGRAVTVSFLAM